MTAAAILRKAAVMLRTSDCIVFSALNYWHHFVASGGMHAGATEGADSSKASWQEDALLAACLLLASKAEEEPRRIRDVINCVFYVMSGERLHDAHRYWEKKAAASQRFILAKFRVRQSLDARRNASCFLNNNCYVCWRSTRW